MKFKVGDTVRRTKDHSVPKFEVKKGDTGVVIKVIEYEQPTFLAADLDQQFLIIKFFKGITCENNSLNVELVSEGE